MKSFYILFSIAFFGSQASAEVTQSYSEVAQAVRTAEEGGFGELQCSYPEEDSEHYADPVQSCEGRKGMLPGRNRTCVITELICQSPATGQFVVRDITLFIPENEKCGDVAPADAFRGAARYDNNVNINGDH